MRCILYIGRNYIMKRWIHASEDTSQIPAGYLKTNRFNCPSIKTDDQRNALEALELAISQKFNQFDKMNEITLHLTSDEFWQGTITWFEEGYYIQLEGTRSSFTAFVTGDSVIRKPRKGLTPVATYKVEGRCGQVEYMSKART